MITLSEQQAFALTLDGEAANQGYQGQHAIACVIMKRVELKWQGETTVKGVCLHHAQFSCWNPGPDCDRISNPLEQSTHTYAQCLSIAQLALAGQLDDITSGADSYEVTGSGAYWAEGLSPVAVIGAHSFYRTRAQPSHESPEPPVSLGPDPSFDQPTLTG